MLAAGLSWVIAGTASAGFCGPMKTPPRRGPSTLEIDHGTRRQQLAATLRRIEIVERHIHKQESRIARLDAKGSDTTLAERSLNTLRESRDQHIAYRGRILLEIAQSCLR